MNYRKESEFITGKLKEAAKIFLTNEPLQKTQKSEYDIVTDIDCKVESFIADSIREAFPGDKVLGEEWSSNEEISGRTWTIDPIDGTVNFAQGMPIFGMQCALVDEGEVVLGAVYLPKTGEMFTAVKGEGLFCNGIPMESSEESSLSNAIVSFGDYTHSWDEMALFQHDIIGKLYPKIAKIRMFGAASIDCAFAAAKRTMGTVVMTRNVWDLLPGVILCREAGLEVLNLGGKAYNIGDYGVIAASGKTLEAIIDALKK